MIGSSTRIQCQPANLVVIAWRAIHDIATYVEGQARDETIQSVEKIKREIVLGETRLIATCPWGNPLAN